MYPSIFVNFLRIILLPLTFSFSCFLRVFQSPCFSSLYVFLSVFRVVPLVPFVEHPEYGLVSIDCEKEVEVTIIVEELHRSRTLKDVPIWFLTPPKYFRAVEITKLEGKAVDPVNPTVDIVISGPGKQLAKIKPEDVTAFLDLTHEDALREFEKPPDVKLPEGIRLDTGPGKPPAVPAVTYVVKLPSIKEPE